jgi:hypothetical protein
MLNLDLEYPSNVTHSTSRHPPPLIFQTLTSHPTHHPKMCQYETLVTSFPEFLLDTPRLIKAQSYPTCDHTLLQFCEPCQPASETKLLCNVPPRHLSWNAKVEFCFLCRLKRRMGREGQLLLRLEIGEL